MHDWIYVRTREQKAAGRPSVGYQKVSKNKKCSAICVSAGVRLTET